MSTDQTALGLSIQEVADLLGVHYTSVSRKAKSGAVSRYRAANGTWRIPQTEVERLVAARRQELQDRAERTRTLARLRAQLRRSA